MTLIKDTMLTNTTTGFYNIADDHVAHSFTDTGAEAIAIPLIVISMLVSVLGDMFNWRERGAHWLASVQNKYWPRSQEAQIELRNMQEVARQKKIWEDHLKAIGCKPNEQQPVAP